MKICKRFNEWNIYRTVLLISDQFNHTDSFVWGETNCICTTMAELFCDKSDAHESSVERTFPPHFAWARGSNQFFCAFTVFKSKHLWGEKKILVSDNRYTSEWILTLMKQKETNAQNPQKNILDSAWWVRRKLMTAVYFESFTFKSKVVWLPSLISCFVKQQSSCHI